MEKVARWWPLVLIAVGLVLYLPLLDVRPSRFEEGRRALQAIEMLDGGSWWLLKVLGEDYVYKPPFTPWLMASSAWLGIGMNEYAIRLPGVLFTVVGALAAGALASSLAPRDKKVAALCAGLAFLCTVNILLKGRVGETDVTVTALCGLAFWIWADARRHGRLGLAAWALVALFLAAAALTKGPIPVAFPLIAMLAIPLMQKRFNELFAAVAAAVVAFLPLGYWAMANWLSPRSGHWVTEIGRESVGWADLTSLLYLNGLPLALLYLLPFLPAAVAMLLARRSLPVAERWPIDALMLFAVPMLLVTTVPPSGNARYSMPAAFPVVVLAALWIAMKWREKGAALTLLFTGVVIAVIFQIVQIGFLDGRTTGQIAMRAKAEELARTLEPLPAGAMPLLWTHELARNHNLLVYAGRRLFIVQPFALACGVRESHLIASVPDRPLVEQAGGWRLVKPLADWGLLYERSKDAAGCS